MNTIQNILVAYDGSEESQRALDYAVNFAYENEKIVLHLITVYQPAFSIAYTYANYPVEQANYELKEKNEEMIQNVKTDLSFKTNLSIVAKAIEGYPGNVLTHYASMNSIDLIVIGSRGLSGVKELFLGSVSHHVVQKAECPVLVIK
ncbi:universal stress protein [Fictibacillus barbaricus]|uniref:Nucleotide-binding universal stress UspA family protein n=1 Tax=Fictibacillus barbaricus TaxID=182136 RepID=A0ABU1TX53_9BACL|nr:universal stress protein [Fictibacillus barbaricus]MDR7071759.1 nucleotide-binding universal stress UspA family protein [Fictibacillus barbaricus]